jgi:hypothetical protein
MKEALLDQLGALLVTRVRDEMISHIDEALEGKRPDIYSRQLYHLSKSQSLTTKEFVQLVIPYVVDGTIGVLLQLIDTEDSIALSVKSNDKLINTKSLTESLEAEYGFSDGWINRFSKVRKDEITARADAEYSENVKLPWDPKEKN